MKTWRARYVLEVYVRAEDDDPMDEQSTPGRQALDAVWEGVRSEMRTIADVLGAVTADVGGMIDCEEITGTEDDPFPQEEAE